MKSLFDLRSLPTRMILSTIFVVVVTALTVGLPAIWVIRGQLIQQAWEQLQRGQNTIQALYDARQIELSNLATLITQRPTLQALVSQQNPVALQQYLSTLRGGAMVDHILLCDLAGQPIGYAGEGVQVDLCQDVTGSAVYHTSGQDAAGVHLSAARPLVVDNRTLGFVVLADDIDQDFVRRLSLATGLEQTLLVNGQPVASSFIEGGNLPGVVRKEVKSFTSTTSPITFFELDGQTYYSIRFPLSEAGFEIELAEHAGSIGAAQDTLLQSLLFGMLVSVLLGILLGVLLSRQISQPLVQLAQAASGLSQGDLTTPVVIDTGLNEEAMVAKALEDARVNLLDTLSDLQQEKAWSDQLLDAIIEGIMTLDSSKRITFFSHGAERITGWGREEVLQRDCDQVFRVAGSETPFSQFIPEPGTKTKLVVELADGRWASLSFSGARLVPSEAGVAEVALVFRDVSSEEIVHHMLGQFTANIAHEFRTPLSAVAASAELLKDQAAILTVDELQELTHSIHLGILSLQTLVDNLLEGASIEAGHFRISPRPCSLEAIIDEAVTTMQPLLDKYDQNLLLSLPKSIPAVYADPRRTLQVLINLLSNASKYGPAEAEIALGAHVNGTWVRVEVSDRGPGIPPGQRSDLFRRFVYPEAAPEHGKIGVGLGLSVVKAIIEAQGGQTGVEDRAGGGSTFWFTLPVAGNT